LGAAPERSFFFLSAKFSENRLAIEVDEPPILRVLDLLCHNEQARAQGEKQSELYPIRWHERLMAPWLSDLGLVAIFARKRAEEEKHTVAATASGLC
jgi:hypothetical protein